MRDFSHYTEIGRTINTINYVSKADPDIMIIVPLEGTKDTAEDARQNVVFFHDYSRKLGRSVGNVVIMSNMLAQEPEARRAYMGVDPNLVYAAGLVVENAISRALGSFFIGLSRPAVPTKLFNSLESAIEWLKTMRPG